MPIVFRFVSCCVRRRCLFLIHPEHINMQLHIRGSSTHVLAYEPSQTVAEIKVSETSPQNKSTHSHITSIAAAAIGCCCVWFGSNESSHILTYSHLPPLQAQVAAIENIDAAEFQLSCEGRILEAEDALLSTLTNYELDMIVPLVGGKVHGSLARAGKVKGQTPKAEKQEKKKKKTGRAKRRIQYNRRFVNVVATFGRRRGPNANAGSA